MDNEIDEAYNNELIDFLEQLITREELESAAFGISKQVIDKGAKSMSPKQKYVINNLVENYKKKTECELCKDGNIGSLTDYIYIVDNGVCPTCKNADGKFMKA